MEAKKKSFGTWVVSCFYLILFQIERKFPEPKINHFKAYDSLTVPDNPHPVQRPLSPSVSVSRWCLTGVQKINRVKPCADFPQQTIDILLNELGGGGGGTRVAERPSIPFTSSLCCHLWANL